MLIFKIFFFRTFGIQLLQLDNYNIQYSYSLIFVKTNLFSLFLVIVNLKYVLKRFKVEKVCSGVAVVTGRIANICKSNYTLSTISEQNILVYLPYNIVH